MPDDDRDLRAIRTLVAPRLHGAPPAWRAVSVRLEKPPPRRRSWLRLEVPVFAVVALIAVVAVVVVLRWYGDSDPGTRGLPREVAISPTPSAPTDFRAIGDPGPYPDVEPVDPYTALAELARVAESTGAATIAPGQLIYERLVGWVSGPRPSRPGAVIVQTPAGPVEYQEQESWLDPEGMIRLPTPEEIASPSPKSDPPAELAGSRARYAADGPSLGQPSPQWLAQLPTDSAQLREILDPPGMPRGSWSPDHEVFGSVRDLCGQSELLLTGGTRAGLIRLLAQLPNLTAARLVAVGQPLVAIRYTETITKLGVSTTSTDEILFDPATGHAIGTGALFVDGGHYQAFWTQSVVNTLGDRQ